jgi:peptidoglycan/LPS O-acetylase OafA/YrhL
LLIAGGGVVISAGWIAGMAGGLAQVTWQEAWLPTYAVWFAAGMTLAVIQVALATSTAPRQWQIVHRVGAAPGASIVLAAACLAIATTPLGGPRGPVPETAGQLGLRVALYLVVAVLLVIAAGFGPPNRTKRALDGGLARWLGSVSYGLFLWHLPVLEAVYYFGDRPLFTGQFVDIFGLVLAGGLLLATISWYVIERPLLAGTLPAGTLPASTWPDGTDADQGLAGQRLTDQRLTGRRLADQWLADRGFRGGSTDDRHPEHRDGEQPGQLRPGRDVIVLAQGDRAREDD